MRLFWLVTFISLSLSVAKVCSQEWPLWQSFQDKFISSQGRVIDPYLQHDITTSEGQSYALFFALVNNQPDLFDKILQWTNLNLASGDLSTNLPSWLWGKSKSGNWQVLDSNTASDADLWIIYSLVEAARLWQQPKYFSLALQMSENVLSKEVIKVDGLGAMLLPGIYGFYTPADKVKLNPSYMPLQILQCFEKTFDNKQWSKLLDSSYQFILASSPEGFSPDWIEFDFDKGLQFGQNIGSYNAIRVYLWGGMLNSEAKFNVQLKTHLQPMVNFFIQNHFVPTEINVVSLDYKGQGDMGFLASILPLVHTSKNKKSVDLLLSLIDEKKIIAQNNYYQHALSLFALGWYHQKYRFLANGCLQVPWKK